MDGNEIEMNGKVGTIGDNPLLMHDRQLRRELLKEIKCVFEGYSRNEFPDRLECMEDELYCSQRNFCKSALIRGVETASMAFLNGDAQRTMEILSEMEEEMKKAEAECGVKDCRDYALSMLSEVRTVFSLAMRITDRLETGGETEEIPQLDWEEVAERLKPLSHPNRLSILNLLKEGPASFSTISSELGLRTGHLQFHLGTLEEVGHIRKGDQRGIYEITLRGMTALEGVQTFAASRVSLD